MRRFPARLAGTFGILKKLTSPAKVQDFLDTLRINFEPNGDTCRSPRAVLARGEAHCMEGALLAAAAFWRHGHPPLLLDLKTRKGDESHVVALFKEGNRWGAVSKTNHAVLRYRDPIFKTIRELALSYFNEYFLDNGEKTLRSYSRSPLNLLDYDDDWLTSRKNLWHLTNAIDHAPHINILEGRAVRRLRLADPIERSAGKLLEWKEKKNSRPP